MAMLPAHSAATALFTASACGPAPPRLRSAYEAKLRVPDAQDGGGLVFSKGWHVSKGWHFQKKCDDLGILLTKT
jgi:hypothetical protein